MFVFFSSPLKGECGNAIWILFHNALLCCTYFKNSFQLKAQFIEKPMWNGVKSIKKHKNKTHLLTIQSRLNCFLRLYPKFYKYNAESAIYKYRVVCLCKMAAITISHHHYFVDNVSIKSSFIWNIYAWNYLFFETVYKIETAYVIQYTYGRQVIFQHLALPYSITLKS